MCDSPPAVSGASGAFEADALQCLDDVARFARSLSRSEDAGNDLVQETYLRAFRSRHTWQDGADMRRWLFTICKNVFLRGVERTRDTMDIDDAGSEALSAVHLHTELVASGEAGLFDRIDVGPAITHAVADLTPAFRAVIVLIDMEGYGYGDAAQLLDVPVGTIRSRLFRARRLLQLALRAHGRDAGFSLLPRAEAPSRDHDR